VQHLTPIQIVNEVRRLVDEREWSMVATADFLKWTEDEIIEKVNDAIQWIFKRYIASHGAQFTERETITIVGSTQEYSLTEQSKLAGVLEVVDNYGNLIPNIDYHQQDKQDLIGDQAFWIREVEGGTTKIGILYPASMTTFTVSYVRLPRVIAAGRGTTAVSAGTTMSATVGGHVPLVASYYATTNKVESVQISNGKPYGTIIRSAVTAFTAAGLLTFGSTLTAGTDIFWGVMPEWAPYDAKEFICKKAAVDLMGHKAPARFLQEVEMAELRFRCSYGMDLVRSISPLVMRDEII
jgi:hypothetical protein